MAVAVGPSDVNTSIPEAKSRPSPPPERLAKPQYMVCSYMTWPNNNTKTVLLETNDLRSAHTRYNGCGTYSALVWDRRHGKLATGVAGMRGGGGSLKWDYDSKSGASLLDFAKSHA